MTPFHGGYPQIQGFCGVCGRDDSQKPEPLRNNLQFVDDYVVCQHCAAMIDIGRGLRQVGGRPLLVRVDGMLICASCFEAYCQRTGKSLPSDWDWQRKSDEKRRTG